LRAFTAINQEYQTRKYKIYDYKTQEYSEITYYAELIISLEAASLSY